MSAKPSNPPSAGSGVSSRVKRVELIKKLEAARGGRLLVSYVTSTRSGHEIQMADDVLRLLFEHLESGKEAARKGIDLLIHSNGGSGTVPWRLVSLIREYTKNFAVLVPHKAFSAATLVALGADEILMHRMGCLGPIDPSVANIFNPPHPQIPGQPAPISVEDVTAYFKLIKEDVGITHEDELVQAFLALAEKVHPLALGNVQRHHNQSRLMASKLLRMHMPPDQEHEISQIVENLKSNLFFHGHPISRREARDDLKLKVKDPDPAVEELMWAVYEEYENDLSLKSPLQGLHELDSRGLLAPVGATLTTQDIVKQMVQLQQYGVALGAVAPQQLVELAAAMLPIVSSPGRPRPRIELRSVRGAILESSARTDVFLSDLAFERISIPSSSGPQDAIKQESLWHRWEEER